MQDRVQLRAHHARDQHGKLLRASRASNTCATPASSAPGMTTKASASSRPVRAAVGEVKPTRQLAKPSSKRVSTKLGSTLISLTSVVSLAAYGYHHFKERAHRAELESLPAEPVSVPVDSTPARTTEPSPAPRASTSNSAFRCDGRTRCTQMHSCEEATWFINHCPGTEMNGNHDGVPCEQQWCTGTLSR
jgi:hypothetical protein